MANTIYEEIYAIFQSGITDPVFSGSVVRDDFSKKYLISSITKFRRCLQNLNNRDDVNSTFNLVLTDDEKQILGSLMVVEHLNPQIMTLSLIKQSFSNDNFRQTSQANHLKELSALRKDLKKEINKMIVDYTYTYSDLSKLKSQPQS